MKFRCTVRIQTEPLHVNVSPQKMQLYPFPVWFFCCKLNRKIKGNKSQHRPINQSINQSINSSYIPLFHLLSTWFPQYFTPSFLMVFFPFNLQLCPGGGCLAAGRILPITYQYGALNRFLWLIHVVGLPYAEEANLWHLHSEIMIIRRTQLSALEHVSKKCRGAHRHP